MQILSFVHGYAEREKHGQIVCENYCYYIVLDTLVHGSLPNTSDTKSLY